MPVDHEMVRRSSALQSSSDFSARTKAIFWDEKPKCSVCDACLRVVICRYCQEQNVWTDGFESAPCKQCRVHITALGMKAAADTMRAADVIVVDAQPHTALSPLRIGKHERAAE